VFSGGNVSLYNAQLSSGFVNFYDAQFSGATVDLEGVQFFNAGAGHGWHEKPTAPRSASDSGRTNRGSAPAVRDLRDEPGWWLRPHHRPS
jgi:hypothetical protein